MYFIASIALFGFLEQQIIFAPLLAKSSAVSFPIPALAPNQQKFEMNHYMHIYY